MPFRKTYRRRAIVRKRKPNTRRKATPRRQVATIGGRYGYGNVRSPFPPILWTALSFTETVNISQASIGVPQVTSYRANGMYDPRVALGGLQPRYYDSLLGANDGSAPYRHYRVHSSAIEATVWPTTGNANAANCLLTLLPRRSVITSPGTIDEQRERPYSKHLAMTTTGSYKPRKFFNFIKMKTLLGHKDLQDVDNTAARYDNLPVEECIWDLLLCDVQGSAVAQATVQVTVTYYVQLYGLSDVADS